jgi:hypothetical protein
MGVSFYIFLNGAIRPLATKKGTHNNRKKETKKEKQRETVHKLRRRSLYVYVWRRTIHRQKNQIGSREVWPRSGEKDNTIPRRKKRGTTLLAQARDK